MAGFPGAAPESHGLDLVLLPDGWGEQWWEEKPSLFGVFLTIESSMLDDTSKSESNL